jgi:hypothetical protein
LPAPALEETSGLSQQLGSRGQEHRLWTYWRILRRIYWPCGKCSYRGLLYLLTFHADHIGHLLAQTL